MADILAGINFVVRITDKSAAFKELERGLRELRIAFLGFEQLSQILGRVGGAFDTLGMVGVRALESMLAPSMAYENALTQIGALAGFNETQTHSLSNAFLELSATLPLTAQQLAEVGQEAVRAGASTQAALEAIAVVSSKLSVIAPDLTASQAAKHLISISTQFGQTGDKLAGNVARLGDAFAQMDKFGIGTSGELANIVKRFGFMANKLGISQEEALAFAAALRQAGIQTEVAGTAMQQVFGRLANSTDKWAAASGLQSAELKSLLSHGKGLEAVMKFVAGINKKTGGDVIKMTQALHSLGIDGSRTQNVLLGLVSATDLFSDALDASKHTTGALDRSFSLFATSLQMQFDRMMGAWQAVGIAFGETLKPILVPFIMALTAIAQVLLDIPDPIKFVIVVLIALVSAVLLTLGFVFSLIAGFFVLITTVFYMVSALTAMKTALADLAAELAVVEAELPLLGGELAIAASEVDMLTLPLSGLALELGAAEAEALGMTDALAILGLEAGVATPMLGGTAVAAGGLGAALAAALWPVTVIALAIGVVVTSMIAMRAEIEDLVTAFKDMLAPIFQLMAGLLSLAGEIDPSGSGSLGHVFMLLVRGALWPVIVQMQNIASILRLVGAVFQGFTNTVLSALEPIRATFDRVRLSVAHAIEFFTTWGQRLGIVTKEGAFFQAWLSAIATSVKMMLFPLYAVLRVLAFIVNVFFAVITGGVEGVLRAFAPLFDVFGEIVNEVKAAFNPILDAFAELWAALGLSTDDFDVFGIVVQAVAFLVRVSLMPIVFVLRLMALLVKAVVVVFGSLIKGIAPAIKVVTAFFKALSGGRTFMGFLSDGIKSFFEDIGNGIQKAQDFFIGLGEQVIEMLRHVGDDIANSIGSFFSSMFDGLFSALRAQIAPVISLLNTMIPYLNLAPGVNLPLLPMPAMASGGITKGTGVALLHPQEAVIPLRRLPEMASRFTPYQPTAVDRPLAAAQPSRSAGTSDTPINITIPVTVMLEDTRLGQVVVRITEDELRRQFGSRGVRLAGIG